MSFLKDIIIEQEKKRHNKMDGYRKKLMKDNVYEMECPYCCNALSISHTMKTQCIYCGHVLEWNS